MAEKVWAYSKDAQKIVKNVYDYVVKKNGRDYGAITEVGRIVGMCYHTVLKFVASEGYIEPLKPGNKSKKFERLDSMSKDFVRRTVYSFFDEKLIPTVGMIHHRLIERTAGTDHPFPYEESQLRELLLALGFRYCKVNKRAGIMESARLVRWRYDYLIQIRRYRNEGRYIVYLDETWFDIHDIARKGWCDKSEKCVVDTPASRGKRLVIVHAGGENGFVPGCALLCGKSMKNCHADYHDDMNGAVFEDWFEKKLIPNIPPNSVIVIDNAKYHTRQVELQPTMNSLKAVMLDFMMKNDIEIPSPVPIKPVLLDLIRAKNIKKRYVVDEMAEKYGHTVHRLPPYHCTFNPIEMVWSQLKSNVRRENVYTKDAAAVIDLVHEVFTLIDADTWRNYIAHTLKIEQEYWKRDHMMDELVSPVIISLEESDDEFPESDDEED